MKHYQWIGIHHAYNGETLYPYSAPHYLDSPNQLLNKRCIQINACLDYIGWGYSRHSRK